MATPSEKAPVIEKFLEDLVGRSTAITQNKCTWCKGDASTFTDALSEKEYTISGMCQKCQDGVFNSEE